MDSAATATVAEVRVEGKVECGDMARAAVMGAVMGAVVGAVVCAVVGAVVGAVEVLGVVVVTDVSRVHERGSRDSLFPERTEC
jgi:methionine aminopeptidase